MRYSSQTIGSSFWLPLQAKLKDYSVLLKFRLNLTVVFSAVIGYLLATGSNFEWVSLLVLGLGGFLVTGSANAINQILEKDYDRLMKRTAKRPLAENRMSVGEATLLAGVIGISGVVLLWYAFNEMTALVAAISLLLYAFVYTPLKRISPISVFVGAIPGALPPVIGWLAATSVWSYEVWVLFSIQFLWQFPHFWAIGWLGAADYKKAGYKLLPTENGQDGRTITTAVQIVLYIVMLILVSLIPMFLNMVTMVSLIVALVSGLVFLYFGLNLLKKCDDKAALKVMFASIAYLPFLQLVMVLDRMFLV